MARARSKRRSGVQASGGPRAWSPGGPRRTASACGSGVVRAASGRWRNRAGPGRRTPRRWRSPVPTAFSTPACTARSGVGTAGAREQGGRLKWLHACDNMKRSRAGSRNNTAPGANLLRPRDPRAPGRGCGSSGVAGHPMLGSRCVMNCGAPARSRATPCGERWWRVWNADFLREAALSRHTPSGSCGAASRCTCRNPRSIGWCCVRSLAAAHVREPS